MAKPVLLAVDDDVSVLRAVERDLKRKFSDQVQIIGVSSGKEALSVLQTIRERGQEVSLILSDQRMPEMNGVEFLGLASQIFPSAKRCLLTAYADSDAAIQAINHARLDHYFVKPWDPPEEKLYPQLRDLLSDWFQGYQPLADIRVFGDRWSSDCHQVRDFLAKNQVPYAWIDVERRANDVEVANLLKEPKLRLPLVKFSDGSLIEAATVESVAARVGLKTKAALPSYDLAIIGAGPAGLAAAVYGASEGLQTVVIEREAPGGQAGSSSLIENYLGFPAGLSGADLARRARDQAIRFNVEILSAEAVGIADEGGYKIVKLHDGTQLACRALVLAMGVSYRRLKVPGEERLFNKGVYYGAALVEAVNCTGEPVLIIGGANSAGQAAVHFSKFASKVTMAVRGASLLASMSDYLVEKIQNTTNIEVLLNTSVTEFVGDNRLDHIRLKSKDQETTLEATAAFAMIGAEPHTDWLPKEIVRDARGFILAGPELLDDTLGERKWKYPRAPMLLETSMPGVFAAGDVKTGAVKRVASSVGQGSTAVTLIHEYLREVGA